MTLSASTESRFRPPAPVLEPRLVVKNRSHTPALPKRASGSPILGVVRLRELLAPVPLGLGLRGASVQRFPALVALSTILAAIQTLPSSRNIAPCRSSVSC